MGAPPPRGRIPSFHTRAPRGQSEMNQASAAELANAVLLKLIEHQPNLWPSQGLSSQNNASAYAAALAQVRLTLIQTFQQQPD